MSQVDSSVEVFGLNDDSHLFAGVVVAQFNFEGHSLSCLYSYSIAPATVGGKGQLQSLKEGLKTHWLTEAVVIGSGVGPDVVGVCYTDTEALT